MTLYNRISTALWLPVLFLISGTGFNSFAQDTDTLSCNAMILRALAADTLYTPEVKAVFDVLPSYSKGDMGNVTVNQSDSLRAAFQRHIVVAGSREISGYRIRIYFSNAQNAREASMEAVLRFQTHFEGYNVYRQFINPNFKVTVGDFRTQSEALAFLDAVRTDFPAAFIVREKIRCTD
ncbi:MAG: SPOR domain-containing protein [Bacteroidales bacterium]|nr:SPOR domain-containing protein [Bacteroidales bacterium]